ncbi:restriction endonuclease [bacterium]|nr:restriction endonuclease [bacterium]
MITLIHQQMAREGAQVTESVELVGVAGLVEIDILLEFEAFGQRYRTAVECRARGRRQDRLWIDELIGKVDDKLLGIDKCIAVSKSGFTKGAVERARSRGIELLTLSEAEQRQWSLLNSLPDRFRFSSNMPFLRMLGFGFEEEPEAIAAAFGEDKEQFEAGKFNVESSLKDMAGTYTSEEFAWLFINKPGLLKSKVPEDFSGKGMLKFNVAMPPNTTYAVDPSGGRHQIQQMTMAVEIHQVGSFTTLERHQVGESRLAVGTGRILAGNLTFVITESPEGPCIAFSITEPDPNYQLKEIKLTTPNGSGSSLDWPVDCRTVLVKGDTSSGRPGTEVNSVVNRDFLKELLGERTFLGNSIQYAKEGQEVADISIEVLSPNGRVGFRDSVKLKYHRPGRAYDFILSNTSDVMPLQVEFRGNLDGLELAIGVTLKQPVPAAEYVQAVRILDGIAGDGLMILRENVTGEVVPIPLPVSSASDATHLVEFADQLELLQRHAEKPIMVPAEVAETEMAAINELSTYLRGGALSCTNFEMIGTEETLAIVHELMQNGRGSFELSYSCSKEVFGVRVSLPRLRILVWSPTLRVEEIPDSKNKRLIFSSGQKPFEISPDHSEIQQ